MKQLLLALKNWFSQDNIYFVSIALLVLVLFKTAFSLNFFNDDFYLLKLGQANSILDILNFFNPLKPYGFYRPVSIEIFYSAINSLGQSPITGHIISFATYFVGLIFLYKTVLTLFKERTIARLSLLIYSLHFTHVYQLYWSAAYQEIALFTFLTISFWVFLNRQIKTFLLAFFLALCSREQAIMFPVFLLAYATWTKTIWKDRIYLISTACLSLLFFQIVRTNYQFLSVRPEYALDLNPRLIINNILWYLLWAFGFPSILPDYFPSILGLPIPEFYRFLADPVFRLYLISVSFFNLILATLLLWTKKWRLLFLLVPFLIFIFPALPIVHRWMLRLTVPVAFTSVFIAYLLFKLHKRRPLMAKTVIALFLIWNVLAISFHETSSTFLLESKIVDRVSKIIASNRQKIINSNGIHFADSQIPQNGWSGSPKVKLTLSDQSFLNHFFPNEQIVATYGGQNTPSQFFRIDAQKLIE